MSVEEWTDKSIEREFIWSKFSKFATNLMDLSFIELMLQLSYVNKMYSQPINLTLELYCVYKSREEWDISNGDSAVKNPS